MQKDSANNVGKGGSLKKGASLDERQAQQESKAPTVSKPGGFKNDPDDPTNPNEVRERYNRKLRR
jgi:hypothetical protein